MIRKCQELLGNTKDYQKCDEVYGMLGNARSAGKYLEIPKMPGMQTMPGNSIVARQLRNDRAILYKEYQVCQEWC